MRVPRETPPPDGHGAGMIAERLRRHVDLVRHWNQIVRLISRRDIDDIWQRHVEDSLQLAALIPPGTTEAIDIGSGAGFPGLVLAIATGLRFHLIESDGRKAAFLREAARQTGAPVVVHCRRAELPGLAPAALVTARAVAPLKDLVALAAPMLTPAGVGVFPKGAHADNEVAEARREWHMTVARWPSRISASSTILTVTGILRRT